MNMGFIIFYEPPSWPLLTLMSCLQLSCQNMIHKHGNIHSQENVWGLFGTGLLKVLSIRAVCCFYYYFLFKPDFNLETRSILFSYQKVCVTPPAVLSLSIVLTDYSTVTLFNSRVCCHGTDNVTTTRGTLSLVHLNKPTSTNVFSPKNTVLQMTTSASLSSVCGQCECIWTH